MKMKNTNIATLLFIIHQVFLCIFSSADEITQTHMYSGFRDVYSARFGPSGSFSLQNILVKFFDFCSLGQWLALQYQALGLLLFLGACSFRLSQKNLRDPGSSIVSLGMNSFSLGGMTLLQEEQSPFNQLLASKMGSLSLSTKIVQEYLTAGISSLVQIVKEKERFRKAPPNYAMKKTQLLKEKVRTYV